MKNNKPPKWCSHNWNKKLIIAIQTYTYEVWKVRNTLLHGENKKEQRQKQIAQCQAAIEELYKQERGHLTVEQRELFQVPLSHRKTQGLEAMTLWISTTKAMVCTTLKGGQKTITQCNIERQCENNQCNNNKSRIEIIT